MRGQMRAPVCLPGNMLQFFSRLLGATGFSGKLLHAAEIVTICLAADPTHFTGRRDGNASD